MPPAAWLREPGEDRDVFVSTRWRAARSAAGCPFPHRSSPGQLAEIQRLAEAAGSGMIVRRGLSRAERDYLLGSRLISPDFLWLEPNRSVLLDDGRAASVMVNEEDHIRIQSIRPGLDIAGAQERGKEVEEMLARRMDFARHPSRGWLAASPSNCGAARRLSVLVHLIGLAHTGRLRDALAALGSQGLTARGLYGESSHAVGAFYQISLTQEDDSRLAGACQYLLKKEREARHDAGAEAVTERFEEAERLAEASQSLSLADALRILAWRRWRLAMASPEEALRADEMTAVLEVNGALDPGEAARRRAAFVRGQASHATPPPQPE